MKKALCLALSAGVCASIASAQDQPVLPYGGEIEIGFAGRTTNVNVYDAVTGGAGGCPNVSPAALGTGGTYVLEDVNFVPGPWGPAHTGARDVNVIVWQYQTGGWTGTPIFPVTNTPSAPLTHIFEFYGGSASGNAFNTGVGLPMLANPAQFTGSPVTVNGTVGSGFGWTVTANLTSPVVIGTHTNVFVATRACIENTTTRIADAATGNVQPPGETAVTYGARFDNTLPCTGASTIDYGRDSDGNDQFLSGAAPLAGPNLGNPNDWRTLAQRQCLRLQGFAKAAAPTPDFTFCNLPDGLTSQALTVPAGNNVRWVKLCLAGPVDDDTLRYLNIDTEGSGEALALALYNAGGAIVARDNGSGSTSGLGSGNHSQLTFGVGRSAGALPDGTNYDGRDGELAAGDYYLAICAAGSSFGAAFTPAPAAATGAASTVRIRTNVNAGGSLLAAAAPAPDHFDHSGTPFTFASGDNFQGQSPDTIPNPSGDNSDKVLWSKITLSAPGAVAASGTYLDLDTGASTQIDTATFVFNSTGGLVAFSDDQTAGNLRSALSFGVTSPARSTANGQLRNAANDPTYAWAGQDGDLPAGDYYVAICAWPFDVIGGQGGAAPTVPNANGRFHARGLSGNNVGMTIDFFTGQVPVGPTCDTIDFNNDGLFPDTLDVDDFLSVFGGGPCSNDPNCGDIDFNNDGLFPDTLDIDALLSVFGGGPCL